MTPPAAARSAARGRACPSRRRDGSDRGSARSRASAASSSRRSSLGGATRPKKSPWSTEADGFGSWPSQSSIMSPSSQVPRGTSRAPRPSSRATGAPNVRPTSSGVKAMAQPSSALSSTGISISMPLHPLRCGGGGLERGVRAQRGAADHRLLHPDVVKQRDRLAAEGQHAVVPHLGRPIRVAVAEQVEAQHPVAARPQASPPADACIRRENSRPGSSTTTRSPSPYSSYDEPMALELEIPGHHSRPQ